MKEPAKNRWFFDRICGLFSWFFFLQSQVYITTKTDFLNILGTTGREASVYTHVGNRRVSRHGLDNNWILTHIAASLFANLEEPELDLVLKTFWTQHQHQHHHQPCQSGIAI
jgi:hypothetical protein